MTSTNPPWPGNTWCLQYARDALSRPPTKRHIVRPEPTGELVWECVVPAAYCLLGNRRTHWRVTHRARRLCFLHMYGQTVYTKSEPLPGRPCVHVVRFTSSRPDVRSNWDKAPVDSLTTRKGLGLLRDDKPEAVDLHAWWEPGKRGRGFVLVRVFEGDE